MEDVAEEKAHKYGSSFLDCIVEFCCENKWSVDEQLKRSSSAEIAIDVMQIEEKLLKVSEQARISYSLFEKERKSMDFVTAMRGVKSGTIVSNLCDCILVGLPVDLTRLNVTKQVEDAIIDVIRKPPINSDISKLAPIKKQLPDKISYDQIRIVITILQCRYGISGNDLSRTTTCTSSMSSTQAAPTVCSQQLPTSDAKRKLPVNASQTNANAPKKLKQSKLFS